MSRLKFILYFFFLIPFFLEGTPAQIKTLYNSLDPKSVSQHLAFYQLYPNSEEGRKALSLAWKLLSGNAHSFDDAIQQLPYLTSTLNTLINLINRQPQEETPQLNESELKLVEHLAQNLPNRKLKGHQAKSEAEVLALTTEEIDLARGLFLSQFETTGDVLSKIRSYEALLDLMALQILARTPLQTPPEDKIQAINAFVFEEMGFRFPPHSLYAKDIDLYTFLPSVLDSRRGVCLGVSILYICLAQRLNLPLEMITPPGHIYVRYREGNRIINIETTARGIDLDSEDYLGIDTRSLQQRNVKEVIGLAHFNQASVFWKQEDYPKALQAYQKALPYLPNDMLLRELLAFSFLLGGFKEKGESLLKQVKNHLPDYSVSSENMAEDYLNGAVDIEGINAIFLHVDETRESIIKKRQTLEKAISRFPKFRSGYFNLAITWLQLHREREALECLKTYHTLDPNDCTAEYYLAVLLAKRLDYNKSWEHLRQAETLVHQRKHEPKILKHLRKELSQLCPE